MHNYQIPKIDVHIPEVDVIESYATPFQDHLCTALDLIWSAMAPAPCSRSTAEGLHSSRLSISAVLHFWFAAETAVNLALFHKLKNKKSPYFLKPKDRKLVDRTTADEMGRLSFEKRVQYLKDDKNCCTHLDGFIGKLRQFEKVRNAIVHGYVYKKEQLVSPSGPTTIKTEGKKKVYITAMKVEESAYSQGGKQIDPLEEFKELGFKHHLSELCCHDAMICAWVSFGLLSWLDSHYGIIATASWRSGNKNFRFSSRAPGVPPIKSPTPTATVISGYGNLIIKLNERATGARAKALISKQLNSKKEKSSKQNGPRKRGKKG